MMVNSSSFSAIDSKIFVVLEGVDGSGKSTVASLLRNEPDIEVVESPPNPFGTIKQSVLEKATPMARFAYFVAGNMQISSQARDPSRRKHLLCVRYIFTTVAYHAAIENIEVASLQPIVQVFSQWLMLPDIVIFLNVSQKVQTSRLSGRVDDMLQTRLASSTEFQIRLRRAYEDTKRIFNVNWVNVDTSNLMIEEVARTIREMLPL